MIVFVYLDGTLTHTADVKYKEIKDGLRDFNPTQIPLFHGSVDFISTLKNDGHRVIVLPDSHPKYVRPIVEYYFNVEYIFLADKPNAAKALSFILSDESLNGLYQTNRCLARQENGSCDKFSKADLYYQIDNPQRKNEDLAIMAKGVIENID